MKSSEPIRASSKKEPKSFSSVKRNETGGRLTSTPGSEKGKVKMELYSNNEWTERYEDGYLAEAIYWSENGNHVTIYGTGSTVDEVDRRLMNALRELKLAPEASAKGNTCSLTDSESPNNASGGDEIEGDSWIKGKTGVLAYRLSSLVRTC